MATQFTQSVLSIEISEENVYLTQLGLNNNIPTVTKVKTVNIPPRSILDGIIADPEAIADQVQSIMEEDGFDAENVIIAMNDDMFLKRCDQFNIEDPQELRLELQNSIRSSILFRQKDFQLGFQESSMTDFEDSSNDDASGDQAKEKKDGVDTSSDFQEKTILYAALSTDLIDNLTEFVKLINKTLVSIDLISLSVLRAKLFNSPPSALPQIHCFFNSTYIDFNIVVKQKVVISHVFRKPLEDVLEDEFLMDSYILLFKQLLLTFSSKFPSLPMPEKMIYFSRVANESSFLDVLASQLDLSIEKYDVSSNITFLSVEKNKEKLDQYSQQYLPGIGLSLKFFEAANKTLNITKLKKKFAPIFNKRISMIYAGIFAVVVLGCFILNYQYLNKLDAVYSDLDTVKNKIRAIQKGQTSTQRQRRVKSLQDSIDFLSSIRNDNESKYVFFYKLVETLPLDMSFSRVSIQENKTAYTISISGQAFFKDSIFKFYDLLKSQYANVDLRDIKSKYDDDVTVNTFSVSFEWKIK